MKRLLLLGLILLTCALTIQAQDYGNSWIDFSKTYYKFYVNEEADTDGGLYRVPYSALVGAGLSNPVGADLKVFSRGQEVPIHVTTNGAFSQADYIEFFAIGNDGYFDTQLYKIPEDQSHAFSSLFNPEIAYFITSAPGGNNLRFDNVNNNINGVPAAEQFFIHESKNVLFNVHHRGQPKTDIGAARAWFAEFELGEGYTGPLVTEGNDQFVRMSTKSQYTGGGAPSTEVEVGVVSLDGTAGAFNDTNVKTYVRPFGEKPPLNATPDYAKVFPEYQIRNEVFTVANSQLGPIASDVYFRATNGFGNEATQAFPYKTKFAATYALIRYAHTFDFENKRSFHFTLNVGTGKYIEISNFNGGSTPVLIDRTANKRYLPVVQNGVYKVFIPFENSAPGEREFYISSGDNPEVTQVATSDLSVRNFTNYANSANQGDYVIIYHDQLTTGPTNWVEEFRKYRQLGQTTASGRTSPVSTFNVVAANIDELYDQFAHGIVRHPLGVKNFINYIKGSPSSWNANPEHLLILGKGVGYQDFRSSPENQAKCLVPTYGHQPSDVELTTPNVLDYRPSMGTGRIPAQQPGEVRAYLEKLIEYEQLFLDAQVNCTYEARRKMKDVLFMTKGWGQAETNTFHGYTSGYIQSTTSNNNGWNVVDDIQDTEDHGPGPVRSEIAGAINNGLAMIMYNGHSHGEYWEFNGHFDKGTTTLWPENFNNQGCYPFVLSNSCFVGQIHRPGSESQSEDYVLADDKGSIGFLATLALAYPSFLDIFSKRFIQNISADHYGESIGLNIRETIRDVYSPTDTGVKVTCLEFTYAGDPAVQLYHFDAPEYIVDDVILEGTSGGMATLRIGVYNMGKAIPGQQLAFQVTSTSASGQSVVHPIQSDFSPSYYSEYLVSVPVGNEGGSTEFAVTLDPNNVIAEDCDDTGNNFFSTSGETIATCPGSAPVAFTGQSLVGASSFCIGDEVFYSISESFVTGASYNWNFGNGASPSTANTAGPHLVTYASGGSKQATLSVDFNDGCGPIASPSLSTNILTGLSAPTGLNCANQGNNVNLTWLAVSGALQYQVTVNGIDQGTVSGNSFLVNNPQGGVSYDVVALGSNGGCESVAASYTCTGCVPAQIQFQNIAANQAFCASDNAFALSASPAGGSFMVNGLTSSTFNPQSALVGTNQIDYNYVDGQGCPASSSISVNVSAAPSAPTALSCAALQGNTVTFNWQSVAGSTGYTVRYNGVLQAQQTSTSFTTTIAGNNTIEVASLSFDGSCESEIAAYQCQECAAVSVTVQGISSNQGFCLNEAPVSLSGIPAGGLFSGQGVSGNTFFPSSAGEGNFSITYSFTDAAGCLSTAVVPVQVGSATTPNISGDINICPGESAATYNTAVNFGTYTWGISGNGTIVSGQGTNVITVDWGNSTAGTVSLETANGSGCVASNVAQISIASDNVPQAAFSINSSSLCVGGNVTLQNGSQNASLYQWTIFNTNTQTSQSLVDQSPVLSGLEEGTFNVTLNAIGCGESQAVQTFTVTTADATIQSPSGNSFCQGDEVSLFSGNTSGTFSWSGPNINGAANGQSIVVSPEGTAETYTLVYSDVNGCTDERSFELSLSEGESPLASFSVNSSTFCLGEEIVVTNNSQNGIGFDWNFTNTSTSESITSSDFSPALTLSEPGTYSVAMTISGCNGTDEQSIDNFFTIVDAPSIALSASANVVCPGGDINLNASAAGSVVTWAATVDGALASETGETVSANVVGETTFFVTATNVAGCSTVQEITISTDATLCSADDPTCSDGVQNGQETGIDCGGPECPVCSTCDDEIQNGLETGVDCGGPNCPACPSCNDGEQNGEETGVDCGGGSCAPCGGDTGTGTGTGGDGDPPCDISISAEVLCDNGNGSFELVLSPLGGLPSVNQSFQYMVSGTGIDGIVALDFNEAINVQLEAGSVVEIEFSDTNDCIFVFNNAEFTCPSCSDGIQNGDETEIDCGGDCPNDCESCNDNLLNGQEEGVDCGGPDCDPCPRFVPNIITPNGDGENDRWELDFLASYERNHVQLFSRWGSLLFEQADYVDDFDGTVDGEFLPKGTYYYVIDVFDGNEKMTGSLTILR